MSKRILNKRMICFLLTISLFVLTISSCKKKVNVIESFPEKVTNLSSYLLTGKLETMFPTGTKISEVRALYHKPNLYRVEIKNANVEEAQVIIKNGDGVFVLVPVVNKTFKVNTSWPINSSYPYLLQSLSKDIVSDNDAVVEDDGTNTKITVKAKVYENANPTKQVITFNNETGLPTEVLIYDNEEKLLSRLTITNIEENISVNNDSFIVDTTINTMRLSYETIPTTFDRIISYPTYYVEGTSRIDEVITGGATNRQVVMKYGGTTEFTIIEQYVNDSEVIKTEYTDGDIYLLSGVVCLINNKVIKFYENGMEYTLASANYDIIELIKTAESLRIIDEK